MAKSRSTKARKKARLARGAKVRQARKPPSESTAKRATWSGLLIEAGQELRDWLPMDEEGYLLVAGTAHADARAYFSYSVTDEVLAAGGAVFRWLKLLEEMERPGQLTDRFWTESILAEQNTHIRRLVEVLIDLVGFRMSNDQPYYRHLMLLHRLTGARGTQQDLVEFYSCPNRNIEAQVDRLAEETAALEASDDIDIERCWYLPTGTGIRSADTLKTTGPGRFIKSARGRLQSILPIAHARERLALGVSYDRLYARTSRHIHFLPDRMREDTDVPAVARATDECGVLGLDVVVALQELLDAVPGESNMRVRRLLEENPYPAQLSERVQKGTADVGDFVLAYGDLAEVTDIVESKYGYRSYKVLYLANRPMPLIGEDWFPAKFVHVLFSRQSLLTTIVAATENASIPQDLADKLRSSEGAEALRASLVELWDRGLRDYVFQAQRGP